MTFGASGFRLVTRFCLVGLPVYLALCALLIAVYQDHRRHGLEEEIAAEAAATSVSLARAIAPMLRQDDARGAAALLTMAGGTRAIRCLQVDTVTENSVALWPGYPCARGKEPHTITVPIRDDSVILGHLVTHFSTDWASRKLDEEAGFVYGATAIGTLGAFIAFVVAFHMAIGRRVTALTAAIRHKRDTGRDLPVGDTIRDDLGEVARAYDSMLSRTREQEKALEIERLRRAEVERGARAEKAETEARTRFLEAASHELRTPLNGILGAAHILTGPNLTARQKRSTLLLRDAVARMEHTIGAILREANGEGEAPRPRQEGQPRG